MSNYKVVSPNSQAQLSERLAELAKNHAHVAAVEIDEKDYAIHMRLDGKAHFFGYPDISLPIQKGKIEEARAIIQRVERSIHSGLPPAENDARELFTVLEH